MRKFNYKILLEISITMVRSLQEVLEGAQSLVETRVGENTAVYSSTSIFEVQLFPTLIISFSFETK